MPPSLSGSGIAHLALKSPCHPSQGDDGESEDRPQRDSARADVAQQLAQGVERFLRALHLAHLRFRKLQLGRALNDPNMKPPIKSLFVYNADPANCVPDSNSARKGMARDDLFVAVHDTFWTDSCNYADIVIPADTQLEHEEFHAAYGHYYYGYSEKCIESGAWDYLSKPVDTEQLLAVLRAWLHE